MEWKVDIAADREALALALAGRIRAIAAEAKAARGAFRLAIPGGSVVSLLGQGLALSAADCSGWQWFWADERCVPPDHPDSNVWLAKQELFGPLGISAGGIHAPDGGQGPDRAAAAYEQELLKAFGLEESELPVFDLVLLGVGEDGHVASLFPGNAALDETRRWVVPVRNAPKPPPDRISLSLPVMRQARHVLVTASGAGKAEILGRIVAPNPTGPLLPAQMLASAAGKVEWWVDAIAAAQLPEPIGSASAKEAP